MANWSSGQFDADGRDRTGAYRRLIEDRGDMTGTQTAAVTARSAPGYGEGRQALLAAAVHVVATRGLRHLTYRSVAQQANVAHGLVAHHFGTRDALLAAALEFSLANSVGSISTEPGSGDLDALFAGVVDMVRANPDDQAFQYELILEARRRPELRPQVEQVYATYREALRSELQAAGVEADDALVHLVFAAVDGLVFQQVCLDEPALTLPSLERLRDLLRPLSGRSVRAD
ncbi:transcriptional regulator, TetR family [Geodermatophilus telluris]|uniref:Transcriptional regulator, TetR family n=2 Tax=Geodermatophilus telluris TaxID=1190417 RepID=A0A1G6MY39_9ACTN|nr:transcriptional regulator, TetR family [Geodermatophilus telluris]